MKSTSTAATAAPKNNRGVGTDLAPEAVSEICESLRALLADAFTLHLKTKNFHWHMTGRNFRDYHLLLDEQADQIFAMTDDVAERARKIGGTTLRSVGDIVRHQRLRDQSRRLHPQDHRRHRPRPPPYRRWHRRWPASWSTMVRQEHSWAPTEASGSLSAPKRR